VAGEGSSSDSEDSDPVRLCEGGQVPVRKKRRVARRRRAAGGSAPADRSHRAKTKARFRDFSPARARFLFGSGRGRARRLRRPDARERRVETDPVARAPRRARAGHLVCIGR
jgi:hypothetical protein